MLTDQPAHVRAVRSGLAPEARRIRRVSHRELPAVEDLAAIQIRQRDLRGRNEEQVPVAGDLEKVLLELGQVAGAAQRIRIHEERRLDLGVGVLLRMELEHEVDQGARQPGAGAHQHREARARHLCGALEIENAELGPDVPVRLRLEVERARSAVPPDLDVVGRGRPDGH